MEMVPSWSSSTVLYGSMIFAGILLLAAILGPLFAQLLDRGSSFDIDDRRRKP